MATTARKRRYDADESRQRLLRAASELFADRGYDHTTARDIGERAEVDAAMIARYFGSKAQLYIAVLHDERGVDPASDFLDPDHLATLLRKVSHQGPGPIYQIAMGPYADADADQAAREELIHRVVDPVRRRLETEGAPYASLRAELLSAALIGIFICRRAGVLPDLSAASDETLLPLLGELLGATSTDATDLP